MTDETAEQKLARFETVLDLQMKEIDRLRLRSAEGAHDVLRRLYLDEAQNPNTRLRAAQAALNVEKPRLESVPPPLELVAEKIEPLADRVARQRRRASALEAEPLDSPKFLKWVERDDGTYPADDDGSK
jgi:hypothetical protein